MVRLLWKHKNFIIAEGLFALLCVLRFWDRRMVGHTVGPWRAGAGGLATGVLGNYYVMAAATAVYFLCILFFSAWVLEREQGVKGWLSFLALFLFPAFLSEDYFGAGDIFGMMVFLAVFVSMAKKRLSPIWLAAAFLLIQLPFLGDVRQELSLPRFLITAAFFVGVILWYQCKAGGGWAFWMGVPGGILWMVLGDYDRGLLSLMVGFGFASLYRGLTDGKGSVTGEGDGNGDVLISIGLLLCIACFVIFWMYGEPLLLEEEILEY